LAFLRLFARKKRQFDSLWLKKIVLPPKGLFYEVKVKNALFLTYKYFYPMRLFSERRKYILKHVLEKSE